MAITKQAILLLSLSGMGFLAHAVTLQHKSASAQTPGSACECLGWRDAYQQHGANCMRMGDETCVKYFMELPNENMCMNDDFGHPEPKQWCYVSSSCELGRELTWSTVKTADQAKFMYCDASHAKLGDKTPLQLGDWSAKSNIELGLAVHFAYPVMVEGMKLTTDVLDFFGLSHGAFMAAAPPGTFEERRSDHDHLRSLLQERSAAGTTTLIISNAGHPPFGIMKGKELYWVNFSEEQWQRVLQGLEFFGDKGHMNRVMCVAGCAETVDPWVSPLNALIR